MEDLIAERMAQAELYQQQQQQQQQQEQQQTQSSTQLESGNGPYDGYGYASPTHDGYSEQQQGGGGLNLSRRAESNSQGKVIKKVLKGVCGYLTLCMSV